MTARDPYVLKDISQQIIKNPNDDSVIIVIGMCEDILKENDTSIAHHAIYILNFIIHHSTQILAIKAEETLFAYFKSSNIINSHKALNIEKTWQNILPKDRYFIVDIIQNFKYHTLVNLLLDNFKEKDKKLIIKSIYALNQLSETRGNRFIRECLHNSDKGIIKASITALGKTGLYWDARLIQKFLNDPDQHIRSVTIKAMRKLLGKNALKSFKNVFDQQPTGIQKIILEEITTLRSPKALFYLLFLLNRSDMNHLYNTIEWGIYNIQTKKKIGTIINFFPTATTKTKYKILNLLGDFDDDKCCKHFTSLLDSNEATMIKSLAAHHLTHYNDKLTIISLKRIVQTTKNRILRYSAIKSLLNMSHDIAKEMIENLLLKHEDLTDEIIMLICKNLKSQTRLFDNDLYKIFLFEILQTGTNDTILSVLKILPMKHNFEIFQLLIELYHDPDYKILKEHIALTQLHIVLDFPYYLSAETLDEDIGYLINLIDPYRANYQILLHLIRLDILSDTDIIHSYIQKNKNKLSTKLNYIINKNQLTIEDLNMVLDYLFNEKLEIHKENFQFIIDNHFDNFPIDKQLIFLNQLLRDKSVEQYSFIIDQYYRIDKRPEYLKNQFHEYIESVL